jgi:hypothetical protein
MINTDHSTVETIIIDRAGLSISGHIEAAGIGAWHSIGQLHSKRREEV